MQTHSEINILLVDDDSGNLISLEAILDSLELNVVRASSGREALKCLLHQKFAVILMDVQMPDLNGIQTAELIRQNQRMQHIPIIFLTAYDDMRNRVFEGYNVGAVDFLFKPVDPRILRAKVAVFVDLFRLEAELHKEQEALEITNQELEQFSYSVSHDLHAPIRHVLGYIEMLIEHAGGELDQTGMGFLKKIKDSASHMASLIDDLLKLSRSTKADLSPSRCDLDHLAREIITSMGSEASGRSIEWKIDPLPEVTADPSLLRQVLVNLFANAIKYTRTRDNAKIHIGSEKLEKEVVVFVKDNGVGFEPAFAQKLFVAFNRLHSQDEFEGTGIGLAIVRRIIERHDGRVWAVGALGQGATFYISLPTTRDAIDKKPSG